MSTSKEYILFVCDQLNGINGVEYKKMFGEYMVYVNERPVLLVCDNCVMVKEVPQLAELMKDAEERVPYDGAKAHYVLDIENRELTEAVVRILAEITPVPKRRKPKA